MLQLNDEETINNWTRGYVNGEWMLSYRDIDEIYHPLIFEYKEEEDIELYSGNDTMQPHMTSKMAMIFNRKFRRHQGWKTRVLPWDTNLLGAFHNLHFTMYMADKIPDFENKVCEGGRDYYVDVPGKDLWIFQLLMKAATECIRDDFVKQSKSSNDHSYRATPIMNDFGDWNGFALHITSECIFYLMVKFEPTIKEDGTFGCKYQVELNCETWQSERVAIYGKNASQNPLRKNMLAMMSYVKKELKRFSKMLSDADFNQPEYALKRINTASP